MQINSWYHVVVVYNHQNISIYINSQLDNSSTFTKIPSTNTDNIYIGNDTDGNNEYFYGKIDDIFIFNRALNENEILDLFNDGKNELPIASAGPDQTVEANQPNAANVQLNGSDSTDPDGDPLTYIWRKNGEIIAGPTGNDISNVVLSLGMHNIELTVDDGNGGTDIDSVNIEIVDTTPPELSVELDPTLLWPPNHKMKTITATVSVNDICDPNPTWIFLSIESNEPEEGPGKKNYPDIEGAAIGIADTEFKLRAERLGNENGRIYTVTYQVTDASGNVNTAEATVVVPHDMGNPLAFDPNETTKSIELFGNYPNPFNPETEIRLNIDESSHVNIIIFNMLGQKIKTLAEREFSEGSHAIRWDGTDDLGNLVVGGLYLCRMQTEEYQKTIHMLFLK